jgi:hypothetical protein
LLCHAPHSPLGGPRRTALTTAGQSSSPGFAPWPTSSPRTPRFRSQFRLFRLKSPVYALQGRDADKRSFADRFGVVLGRHVTGHNGHYGTWRAFGPVSFGALAISGAHMTAHAVQMSYYRHVTPAAESVPDAPAA